MGLTSGVVGQLHQRLSALPRLGRRDVGVVREMDNRRADVDSGAGVVAVNALRYLEVK